MEEYIKQLIEDLRHAGFKLRPPHEIWDIADPDDEIELEDLSYVEEYIYGEEIPISTITGIDADLLPPENKLTPEQQAILADELEKLLELKHFALDFPVNLPRHMRYPFIRKFWNEKHVEMSFGTSHIEFCQYEPENCPYPDYCRCKEFQKPENKSDILTDEEYDPDDFNELPF
jgi:hypothetical protein